MILNASAIESGSYEPLYEEVTLSEDIIFPLIAEFEQSAKAKKLYLSVSERFYDEVPIKTDRYTLTQAIANLIDNSIKYTKVGGIKISANYKKTCAK